MSVNQSILRAGILLGFGLVGWPSLSGAAPVATPETDTGHCGPGFQGGPPPPFMGPPGIGGGGFGGGFGAGFEDRPPPFLIGLKLTEEQQDKVFAIMHAAAPALRDQGKAAHKAREALMGLASSAQYNDSAVANLAQAEGKAQAQLTLLRIRREHQIYGVLTPDQLAQVAKREQERAERREEAPHGEPPGARP